LSLLLSILLYFTGISYIGFLGVLSLLVPFLILINLGFLIYWILKRHRNFLPVAAVLLLAYFVFGSFVKLQKKGVLSEKDIKVLTFNARAFNNNEIIKRPNIDKKIISFVNGLNPDIICFQEFYHIKQYDDNFSNYPYRFVDFNEENPRGKIIQAIFSKHPILDKRVFDFKDSGNSAIAVTVSTENDTISVYNIHLESFGIIPDKETLSQDNSGRILKKMTKTFVKQQEQSNLLRKDIDQNIHKKILCGDFNNTQFSSIYRNIRGNLQDSFLECGNGFGKTIDLRGLPMRIDYIMADADFEFTSHTNYDVKLSDHYPVMATLKLKTDQATVD